MVWSNYFLGYSSQQSLLPIFLFYLFYIFRLNIIYVYVYFMSVYVVFIILFRKIKLDKIY